MSTCVFYKEKTKVNETGVIGAPSSPEPVTHPWCDHPHVSKASIDITERVCNLIGGADKLDCGRDLNSDKCYIPLPERFDFSSL